MTNTAHTFGSGEPAGGDADTEMRLAGGGSLGIMAGMQPAFIDDFEVRRLEGIGERGMDLVFERHGVSGGKTLTKTRTFRFVNSCSEEVRDP